MQLDIFTDITAALIAGKSNFRATLSLPNISPKISRDNSQHLLDESNGRRPLAPKILFERSLMFDNSISIKCQ